VKKNLDSSVKDKRLLKDPTHSDISLFRQCELLGLSLSGYYSQPVPVSEEDLLLMNLIDEQYTRTLYYGVRRMTTALVDRLTHNAHILNMNGKYYRLKEHMGKKGFNMENSNT